MTDRIALDDVRHVAHLARLALTDEEAERCRNELARILEYVEQLEEVDVEAVEPLAQPVPLNAPMREQAVDSALSRDEILAGAPDAVDGFFRVPRVIDA